MNYEVASVSLLALICSAAVGANGRPATDIEWRANYCVPVIKYDIDLAETSEALAIRRGSNHGIAEARQSIQALENLLERLMLSVNDEIGRVDKADRDAATLQGEADIEHFYRSSVSCAIRYPAGANKQLYDTCLDKNIQLRMQACLNRTLLP